MAGDNRGIGGLVMARCVAVMVLVGWLQTAAWGQTVQLPSYSWFSVNTSVMVPDRGSAYLGGVSRSSLGSQRRGTPGISGIPGLGRLAGNRASGGRGAASGTSVHATIIDHEELDRAVLGAAPGRGEQRWGAFSPSAARLSEQLAATAEAVSSREQGLMSVAEIRRLNQQRKAASQEEARRLAAQAWEAERKGSLGAAKIFYQMAYRRADAELQQQIAPRLKKLIQGETAER